MRSGQERKSARKARASMLEGSSTSSAPRERESVGYNSWRALEWAARHNADTPELKQLRGLLELEQKLDEWLTADDSVYDDPEYIAWLKSTGFELNQPIKDLRAELAAANESSRKAYDEVRRNLERHPELDPEPHMPIPPWRPMRTSRELENLRRDEHAEACLTALSWCLNNERKLGELVGEGDEFSAKIAECRLNKRPLVFLMRYEPSPKHHEEVRRACSEASKRYNVQISVRIAPEIEAAISERQLDDELTKLFGG